MTKSTSNSPPQGLNWTVLENKAADRRDDRVASETQEESNDIKGLFDRNKKTSLTPLPVGDNISLPPVPAGDTEVKISKGENDAPSSSGSDKTYSPPPVAAFGGIKEASPGKKAPRDNSASESTRGLFSMDSTSDSKEKKIAQTDPKPTQPFAVPKRSRSKKTVVGIGPGQPHLPPIPPAAKDIVKAKEATVSRKPTPVEEKPRQKSKPSGTKPPAPEELADTIFSGTSTSPIDPSKPAATSEGKSESVEEQATESPLPEAVQQPSVEAAPSIRAPQKGKTMRTFALWSCAGLLLLGGLVAVVTFGLNRSASERPTIPTVHEQVKPIEKRAKAAQPRQESVGKVIAEPKAEKPQTARAQPKQIEQPVQPPKQDTIPNQKAEPIEPPNEKPKEENQPKIDEAIVEHKPEQAGNIREMLQSGNRLLRSGDLDQAEAAFRAILSQDTDEHHAMEGLVKILIKRGQAGEALRYCERMVEKRPHRARYRVLYGDALAMTGNQQAAKEQYNEALRYSPDNKEAKRRLSPSK